MKKVLLLLVFVANAALGFAMSGPIKTIEPQNLLVSQVVVTSVPEGPCLICGDCGGLTICGYSADCANAALILTDLLELLKCSEVDE